MSKYTKKMADGYEYGSVSSDGQKLIPEGFTTNSVDAALAIEAPRRPIMKPPVNIKRDELGIFPV